MKQTDMFLSHLCGEEERVTDKAVCLYFLSHLCGEEDVDTAGYFNITFLSHLCGEEVAKSDAGL